MRSVCRTALAAFVGALALVAVAASSALASPEWYNSASKPTPEWQQAGSKITEAAATKWKGTVSLGDAEVPAKVECTATGEGTAGPGAVDKDTSWTLSSCVAPAKAPNLSGEEKTNACEKVVSAEMRDLPWSTELLISRTMFDTIFASGSSGEPAFAVKCKVDGLEITDTCRTTTFFPIRPAVANVAAGVESTFAGTNEIDLKCTVGGPSTGWIGGSQVIEATKGGKLEANSVEPTFSKITKAENVRGTSSRFLTIEDKGEKSIGGQCEVTTEGTITTGGKGTITSYTANCLPTGSCTKIESNEAVGLPWETELYESGGVIRQRIVSSGKGTPGWAFTCTGFARDECTLNVSPEILSKGPEDSVFAVFSESLTKTSCKLGGSEKGVVQGELEISPPEGTTIKAKK